MLGLDRTAGTAVLAGMCLGLLAPPPATGVQAILSVGDIARIEHPRGLSRLLVRFDGLEALEEELVTSATLRIPLSGVRHFDDFDDFDVLVDGVDTPWSAVEPTWSVPWAEPGGDRNDTQAVEGSLSGASGGGFLTLDVTQMVRGIQEGTFPDHGWIVMPAERNGIGFTASQLEVLGDLSLARLEVTYRSLTARGIRGGAQQYLERRSRARAPEDERPR